MPSDAPFQYPHPAAEAGLDSHGTELARSLIVGAVVGAAGGGVVLWVGPTVGLGVLVGLVGGALWWWGRPALERLSRVSASLDAVSVNLDLGVLGVSGVFRAGDTAARALAWDLHVELATRIATQELPDDSGVIRVAMDSLYELFVYTRGRLHEAGPPSVSAAHQLSAHDLAVQMLNGGLRDFLTRWHPRIPELPDGVSSDAAQAQAEATWEDASACREALRPVQSELREVSDALRRLAAEPR